MSQHSRRGFVERSLLGLAGGGLLMMTDGRAATAAAGELVAAARSGVPDTDFWKLVQRQFRLEPGLVYLNNASLGPSPAMVADATDASRRQLDAFPSRWMWGGWSEEVEAVRAGAAELLGADSEEIALIHNTTEGMNLVAASLELAPGDEIIIADHEHPSGTNPWQYRHEPRGVRIVRPVLPLLPADPAEIVDVYRRAITPRTKVISICHVVNTNGMILPVREVSTLARERGILVAVDGAQAPGHVGVDLHALGCDFYAASAHKWLLSPKGVGIFYARRDSQHLLKPLVVARGWEDTSIRRLENYNTRNLPEVLGLGAALDFQRLMGPERARERILGLTHLFREELDEDSRFAVKTPEPDLLSAGITTVEVVGREVHEVASALAERHRIDCRPMASHGLNGVRISLSVFNSEDQVQLVVRGLREQAAGA